MHKLSSFAAFASAALIIITAESAWSDESTSNESAKPAVQAPAPTTEVAPGWYPPPPIPGRYARPWPQPPQWSAPPRGYGQFPPPYPPRGPYQPAPAAPAAAENPLSAELTQTQELLTAKSAELDMAHAMLAQLRGTLQRSLEAEQALREMLADITSEQQDVQARMTELTTALNTTTATLEQQRQQITNDQENNRSLTAEQDRLRSDLASLGEQLTTVQAELQAASEALQQAQTETSTSDQQLSEAKSQAEIFNNELTELQAQLENQKTSQLNAEQSLTEERDSLRSDLTKRDEKLATVQDELQAAREALQQAQTETSASGQQLSEAKSQAEAFNNELTELKAQLESQKTTRLDAEQTVVEERNRLHSDLASRDEQLGAAQAELQTATQALQQAQTESSTAEQQLTEARSQAEACSNELITLKTQLEDQRTTQLDTAQTLTGERDSLRNELTKRDEQLATVQAELQTANEALQQAQTETINNELAEIKAQLESQKTSQQITGQTLTLTAERDRLHDHLASRDEQLATVQTELQAAKEALQQAQDEVRNSGQQLSEARSQAVAFNNELTWLKAQLEDQKTMRLDTEQTLATAIAECEELQENLATCSQELTQATLADVQSEEDVHPAAVAGLVFPVVTDGADTAVEPAASEEPDTGTAEETALQNTTTDTDEDAVPDSIDLCPETQRDIAVDSTGCAAGVAINLEGVNFLYDSHELTGEAQGILDRVAGIIIQQPQLRLQIAGHTDATGDPAYNQELSMQRAEAVRDYLVAQGVNPRYIGAVGYGGQRPIAENTTLEGLRKNRRVELRVLQ